MYIYIYIYNVYITYIYIYTQRERERYICITQSKHPIHNNRYDHLEMYSRGAPHVEHVLEKGAVFPHVGLGAEDA